MKILITGGAGFQGSHLAEHFIKAGHEVAILNSYSEQAERNLKNISKDAAIIWGSITDPEIVSKSVRGMEVVFHLAARINVDESIENPREVIEVNVGGTTNVLEAVRKHGIRLVHASTCEVYGAPYEGEAAISEQHELRPYSPYAASKAGADRICYAYYKTYKIPLTIVRPFNIYGPRQKEGKGGAVIAIFTKLALEGKPMVINGDGHQTRDYLHIKDLIRAYDIVLKNQDKLYGEVINFGSGQETSIKTIAEQIASLTGGSIHYGQDRPGEVDRFLSDNAKAEKFGFHPTVSMEDGIRDYVEWRKQQGS
jgi:dTDP-glucose 4,6-dehydratase